jgi:hypothetical protein
MLATGVLPKVAGLETSFSNLFGLLIHLLVSILLGMSYGLLFPKRSSEPRAWGLMGMAVRYDLAFSRQWRCH